MWLNLQRNEVDTGQERKVRGDTFEWFDTRVKSIKVIVISKKGQFLRGKIGLPPRVTPSLVTPLEQRSANI